MVISAAHVPCCTCLLTHVSPANIYWYISKNVRFKVMCKR